MATLRTGTPPRTVSADNRKLLRTLCMLMRDNHLDGDLARDFVFAQTGKKSRTELTKDEFIKCIRWLNANGCKQLDTKPFTAPRRAVGGRPGGDINDPPTQEQMAAIRDLLIELGCGTPRRRAGWIRRQLQSANAAPPGTAAFPAPRTRGQASGLINRLKIMKLKNYRFPKDEEAAQNDSE